MAGRGSRLRPHTLTVPKPLIPIAGKPIVHRLVEDIVNIYKGPVEEIVFVIGDFGEEVEKQLLRIATDLGSKGRICYQDEPLGTAHAIWMAESSMDDELIIAFADTLFKADFSLNREKDGAIWVKTVDNPSSFGVVTLDDSGHIDGMVEKPTNFVSDLAIIGIYYLRDGKALREEIRYLIDNKVLGKGEYQLTDALENMRKKGAKIVPGKVEDWMDCGNKEIVLETNQKVLKYDFEEDKNLISDDLFLENSTLILPCFIGKGVKIINSVVGPYVSMGSNTRVENSVVKNSLVQNNSLISNVVLDEAMIGNHAKIKKHPQSPSIGDYCTVN